MFKVLDTVVLGSVLLSSFPRTRVDRSAFLRDILAYCVVTAAILGNRIDRKVEIATHLFSGVLPYLDLRLSLCMLLMSSNDCKGANLYL